MFTSVCAGPFDKEKAWEKRGREIPSADREVVAVLRATKEDDLSRRFRLVTALGVLGGDDSVAELTKLLGDPSHLICERAVWGLVRIGDARVLRAIGRLLENEPDDQTKRFARKTLEQIGGSEALDLRRRSESPRRDIDR